MAPVLAQPPEWDGDKPPTLSWALAYSDAVLKLHEEDAHDTKHLKQARHLFRSALFRGAHRRIVLVWYFMELGCRDTAGARACFEEWRRLRGGGGLAGDNELWCHYAWFECQYGTRAQARAVAEAAVAAWPRDSVVFAMHACVELSVGCDRRARRIVRRAHDVFAADEDAVRRITNSVEWHRYHLRAAATERPTMMDDLFRCIFSCVRGSSE